MKWKTNGVDFSIWVLPESFTYLRGDVDVCANKQNYVVPRAFLCRQLHCLTYPSPGFTEEVKEEVLPLSPQPEEVMRFCAPSITRRMRNLIIKERHVAVRKICLVFFFLFFSYCITPRNKGDPHVLFIKSCRL